MPRGKDPVRNYYLRFIPAAKVDYFLLFNLTEIAEYNAITKAFDTIHYQSIAKLGERLEIPAATLNRQLEKAEKSGFLSIDKDEKIITLNNSFTRNNNTFPFVKLNQKEVELLQETQENLFCKYLIYMKYYCGYAKDGKQDFTAKQFLAACGYKTSSNNQLGMISKYNKLLIDRGIITIKQYRDELGHTRNIYAFI